MINRIDTRLYHIINQDFKNSFFDFLMPMITAPDNWLIPVLSAFILSFVIKFFRPLLTNHSAGEALKEVYSFGEKMFVLIILLLIVIGIGDYTNHKIFKPFFGRIRPCNVLQDVNLLVSCTSSLSFPSSHAVNIFSMATVISWQFRGAAIFALTLAIMVSYSRVYVGVHYPFDVAAGGLYGIICGGVVLLIKQKLFKIWQLRNQDKSS